MEKASEKTATNFNPSAAETKAREEPVLPPVYSTIVSPGDTSCLRMALLRTDIATRSLYEPVGFPASYLSHTSAPLSGVTFLSLMIGVFPTKSNTPLDKTYPLTSLVDVFHTVILTPPLSRLDIRIRCFIKWGGTPSWCAETGSICKSETSQQI